MFSQRPSSRSLSSPSSPTSPTMRKKSAVPPGFIASPKPRRRPSQMTVRELYDQHERNARTLSSQTVSTSALIQRVSAEQAAIEARLIDIEGMENIQTRLRRTNISEDEMNIDDSQHPTSRAIAVKRKVLSKYNPEPLSGGNNVGSLSFQEAIELEQRAHAQDMERQRRLEEKRKRTGLPLNGEVLTRQQREARIWAFMNAKPSDSDLEDDSDEEDDDPSKWFEDDQDDGIKFQNIVLPDAIDDFSNVIRVDGTKGHYSSFYEPRDNDQFD